MAVLTRTKPSPERYRLRNAWVLARREIKDNLRDWRIMTPISILTLIFPVLMDVTARLAVDWAAQYDAALVGERLIPFMLLIVGFFPISFSLVIALETFVGEKERNSIEPLLSMPMTDLELYLGKMFAALIVPLTASYTGILVYLGGLYLAMGWTPDPTFLVQMLLLTSVKGLVMVSGAVVVSSQTTSVRAANLLASFIIIPMALLLQVESIFLFWARYEVIWFIIIALLVVDVILVRMGIRIFNREEILAKEMDTLSLKSIWQDFRGYFLRPPQAALLKDQPSPKFNLLRIWRKDLPALLWMHRTPLLVVVGLLLIAAVGGVWVAPNYPLPENILDLRQISMQKLDEVGQISMLPGLNFPSIFFHNVQALIFGGILGLFSFGTVALIFLMIPLTLAGYLAGAVQLIGQDPWLFLGAFVLPHGLLEIPAAIISTAFVLRIGAALVSPPERIDVGQGFLLTLANFTKVFIFLVIPLLLAAAFIEAEITPRIVLWIYGQ
jgi:uncharacterized membrane protein SpoIIM required for sporulation/ABC-type transport system involved in multi-copper enzyme maturation permease subunit